MRCLKGKFPFVYILGVFKFYFSKNLLDYAIEKSEFGTLAHEQECVELINELRGFNKGLRTRNTELAYYPLGDWTMIKNWSDYTT